MGFNIAKPLPDVLQNLHQLRLNFIRKFALADTFRWFIDFARIIKLVLQPRKYFFKTRQKQRQRKPFRLKTLVFGSTGVITPQPLRLTSKQIFRLYIFLKKTSRRSDHTKRSF